MSSGSEDEDDLQGYLDHDDEPLLDEVNFCCLFCSDQLPGEKRFFSHLNDTHSFNLAQYVVNNHLEMYDYIKFINYLRKNKVDAVRAKKISLTELDDESLLLPVLQTDAALQIDLDLLNEVSFETNQAAAQNPDRCTVECTKCADRIKSLDAKIKGLESRALEAEGFLRRALGDLDACKIDLQQKLLSSTSDDSTLNQEESITIENASLHSNSSYFTSYSHHGIHEEMLKDTIRTEAYRDYIYQNKDLFKNKTVLDIGCGTGILSLFSASAGGKPVIGVDQSDVAYQAVANVRENSYDDTIAIIKGSAETVTLPNDSKHVDVIVSEWMGYFLLFEGMLDTVIRCREKFANPETIICPDICIMYLSAVSDAETTKGKLDYWSDVYGFKMNAMKQNVLVEPLVQIVKPDCIISDPFPIKTIDLNTVSIAELDFDEEFTLNGIKDGLCTAICGYFDATFSKGSAVNFSTSPQSTPTHWKQTVFLLKDPVHIHFGDKVRGRLSCKKGSVNPRDLDVKIKLLNDDGSIMQSQTYCMS